MQGISQCSVSIFQTSKHFKGSGSELLGKVLYFHKFQTKVLFSKNKSKTSKILIKFDKFAKLTFFASILEELLD